MEFQVIFNDMPLEKWNPRIVETVYLPRAFTVRVDTPKELYEKIDRFILENDLIYTSYEVIPLKV